MHVLLAHNPAAGRADHSGAALTRLFTAAGHTVTYADVKDHEIKAAEADRADLVAVAGGDGTVERVVRALAEADLPFLFLPFGTANNISQCLGLPMQADTMIRACSSARERRLDVGLATGPWGKRLFMEGVGLGALAEMALVGKSAEMDTDEKRRFGEDAPQQFVGRAQPMAWQVRADGHDLPDGMLMVEILNMPRVGPGLDLGCGGWPEDGALCLSVLRPAGREAFAAWLAGKRTAPAAGLEMLTPRRVDIIWKAGALRIDSHFPDLPRAPVPVGAEVLRQKLRILVPQDDRRKNGGDDDVE